MMQTLLVNKQIDQLAESLQKQFYEFLNTFKVQNTNADYYVFDSNNEAKNENDYLFFYRKQAEKMKISDRRTMFIDMNHLFEFDTNYEIRQSIINEYTRFQPYLNNAIEDFMKNLYFDWANKRSFYASFYHVPEKYKIRELRTSKIGKLISINATVTRTSEVRPELILGSFICKMCNSIVKNIDQQFRYTEPRLCSNTNCSNRIKWDLNQEDSLFSDWQKLRVQENPSDIPPGSMPRSLDVILRNELVETCKPGDKCLFSGSLIVVPDIISLTKPGEKVQRQLKRDAVRKEEQKPMDGVSGLKNLGIRDMTYKLIFVAHYAEFPNSNLNPFSTSSVSVSDSNEIKEDSKPFTDNEYQEILRMKNHSNIYSKLTRCIAPSVYGHDEVKRGILLMLFGGVNKNTSEGIKLRGDLNVCIVGDPSTAKSQFLKYTCQLVPRAVYTSGKGSSAAGLTASVIRDVESGEFCIEAGALLLADNGVCCIDEFDKMDQKDQVAIHEAMEQQTISIAKAGIQATLMARTSVLAAANPLYGRYDKTKPLKSNINISAPIMSRFDLFYVIIDERDDYVDNQIAHHIVNLHRLHGLASQGIEFSENENSFKNNFKPDFTQEQLLLYLKFAKMLNPRFTKEAALMLREEYLNLRQNEMSFQKTAYRITVRQLESLVRLSEALARVHLDELIHPTYVTEAARLLRKSIITVDMANVELELDFEKNLDQERKNYAQDPGDMMIVDKDENNVKKIILSGPEYEKLKTNIIMIVRQLEAEDIKVKHKDIVQYICEENFELLENTKQTEELTEKINAVIERLIEREGVLILITDHEYKSERILSLNVAYEPSI